MNILLVDDDYVDREHIKRVLSQGEDDCNFLEAKSVDQALTLLEDNQFDVILLDYRMPQKNGIDLLLDLKKNNLERSVAIIMLSNSEHESVALECIRTGAQDFVLKSEITTQKLKRSIIHAQARYELENKLVTSYRQAKDLAEHDKLTGLASRHLFQETLEHDIADATRHQRKLALILFDLDHFKYINDHHGHDVGDQLLKKVAKRVKGCLRGNELFARLGGDEFAIILKESDSVITVSNAARRILDVLSKPFDLGKIEHSISSSIGIAIYPDNSHQAESLLKFADIAMYRAKHRGRNQVCFFEEEMQKKFLKRYRVEHQITQALSEREFELYYQPIYFLEDGELAGFEALIRWHLNTRIRLPEEFIGIAEETSQILEIGRWVIRQSISQLANWQAMSKTSLNMAINLSAVQLCDHDLPHFVKSILLEYKVEPGAIEFELTETALLEENQRNSQLLEDLSQLGCRLALDDFGTGYSSVSYLQKYPINSVKIDKSLLFHQHQGKAKKLLKSLTLMLHSLDLDIIAEGIENQSNLATCLALGIQRAQGFYFARPMQKDGIEKLYFGKK